MSINIELERIEGRKRYILTFFFEHHITCKTYSRTIKRAEMGLHNAFLENRPGALPKYLENCPELRISGIAGASTLTAIFTHPDYPTAQKLYIDLPEDMPKPKSGWMSNEPHPAADMKMVQAEVMEIDKVD